MRHLALATLAAAAALIGNSPAFAQPQPQPQTPIGKVTVVGLWPGVRKDQLSEDVSYADLNLKQSGDRQQLRQRVGVAAKRICDRLEKNQPGPSNAIKTCRTRAVRNAMDQVHEVQATR